MKNESERALMKAEHAKLEKIAEQICNDIVHMTGRYMDVYHRTLKVLEREIGPDPDNPNRNRQNVTRDEAAEVARHLIAAANALDAENKDLGIPVARKAVHAAIDAMARAMMLPND
jgi:hypothetical protein